MIQKEIKSIQFERTVQIDKADISKLRGPIQKLVAQYTAASKGGSVDVSEINEAIEAITYWRMHSNKKSAVKEDLQTRKKKQFSKFRNGANSILRELDKHMDKYDFKTESEAIDEAISWLQLNYPKIDANIKDYIIQNNKYGITEDDY